MLKLANELLKIAKDISAGDDNLKKFAELSNGYDDSYSNDWNKMRKEVGEIRTGFINDYVDYVVSYLKKDSAKKDYDPTMMFLGSLDLIISRQLAKKYFDSEYPDMLLRFNNLSNKKVSAKMILKKAYDKAFGLGVFEKTLENNKRI